MAKGKNEKGPYNIDLQHAVEHLYKIGVITMDKDIADKMKVGQGTVSNYINGKGDASPNFRESFETTFEIKLADFEEAHPTPIKNPPESIEMWRAKYLKKLEDDEAFLKRLIESNLIDISERQRTIQAEVQAIQQWDAQMSTGGDEAKAAIALGHIRALVAGNRESLKKKSTSGAEGK